MRLGGGGVQGGVGLSGEKENCRLRKQLKSDSGFTRTERRKKGDKKSGEGERLKQDQGMKEKKRMTVNGNWKETGYTRTVKTKKKLPESEWVKE